MQGVEGAAGATGYFGLSYINENADKLKAVEIDGGAGCVQSSSENAQAGLYVPLARPLFIYVANEAAKRPEVAAFIDFFITDNDAVTSKALFIPLNAEQVATAESAIAGLK